MTAMPSGRRRHSPAHELGPDSEFGRLLAAVLDGSLTRPDRDRLEALLADPDVRAAYRDQLRLHAQLVRLWHRGAAEAAPDGRPPLGATKPALGRGRGGSRRAGPSRGRFAAAVALARGVAAGWMRFLMRPGPFACLFAALVLVSFLAAARIARVDRSGTAAFAAAVRRQPPTVARITGLHRARWPSPQQARLDWEPLPRGARIEVAEGLVQLTHLDGATVVIEGPAAYEVLGPTVGRLVRGRIAARTEHDDRPRQAGRTGRDEPPLFTVMTPTRLVHDLGTEFGVEVHEAGDAAVHVFEGLVELAAVDRRTFSGEVPTRLGAGESAGIDEAGRVASGATSLARRFVRALPQAKGEPKTFLQQLGWNDAAAEMLHRDSFAGSGPLAGTTPESRGGVGGVAWTAPADWTLSPADGAAIATSQGTALLPLQPEPGWLYRISIDLDVFAGGGDWFVMGLAPAMRPADVISSVAGVHAWMGQRHETHRPGLVGNFAFAGPGHAGLVMPIDMATGRQRRSILLDTRGRGWAAYFLRGDEPVARCAYPEPPGSLACVALSQLGHARTRLHGFAVARIAAEAKGTAVADRSVESHR